MLRQSFGLTLFCAFGICTGLSSAEAATLSNPGTIYDFTSTFDSITIGSFLIYEGPFGEITPQDLNERATWNLPLRGGSHSFSLTNLNSEWGVEEPNFSGRPDPRVQTGMVTINAQPGSLTFDLQTDIRRGSLVSTVGLSLSRGQRPGDFSRLVFEQSNSIPPVPNPSLRTNLRLEGFDTESELGFSVVDQLPPDSTLQFPGRPVPEPTTVLGGFATIGLGYLFRKKLAASDPSSRKD